MKAKGIVFIIFSAIGYGLAPVFFEIALNDGATLLQVQFWRFWIATVLFWMLAIPLRVMKGVQLSDIPILIKAGLIGGLLFVGTTIPQFLAIQYMSASVAQVLYFMYPVWVAIISAVVSKTRLQPVQWLLLLCLIVSIGITADLNGSHVSVIGVILAILASTVYASYTLFCKMRMFRRYTGMQMGLSIMTGSLFLYTLCYLFFEPHKTPLSGHTLLVVIGMVMISTFMPIGTYFIGIKNLEPVEIATLASLEPVVTMIAETLILNVVLGFRTYIGATLLIASIIAFVITINMKRKPLYYWFLKPKRRREV